MTQFWGYVIGARSGMLSKQDTLDAIAATAATYGPGTPGRAWRPLVDTTNDPVIAARAAAVAELAAERGLLQRRPADLDRRRPHHPPAIGRQALDRRFRQAFFGVRDRDWGELTYTLDDVVATLNRVQPYDWRGYLQRRVYNIAAQPPLEGISNGGYRLDSPTRRPNGGPAAKSPGRAPT